MSLICARALCLTIGEPLFRDLNFTLSTGDRLGLVAANGRGKTTLLGLLAGEGDLTSGDIIFARGIKCALVRQDVPLGLMDLPLRAAVQSALPAEQAEYESWRVDIALDDLAIPPNLRECPLSQLSGGWQRSAMLARAAVGVPDVYLLDEPTNHLDLTRIGHLQRWLAGLPRDVAVIVTSHDRAFLDAVTRRTMFLRVETSRLFPVPYSAAKLELEKADLADARRFENDIARADQLRKQAAKLKNIGINSGSDLLITKTKQLTQRAEKLETAARPAHREGSAGAIKLGNSGTHAKALLALNMAQITAPNGRALFGTGQKWIEPGQRVVLLGSNGAGKSQMLRAVLAAIAEGAEAIKAAPSLVHGYSDQHLAQLPSAATPFELVSKLTEADATARSLLAGAGMRPDLQGRKVATLSGGQKARLAMLLLRLARPNFYILDEPTNHLDIEGQDALQSELQAIGATCLLVSHDRHFVRAVGTRFWHITGKTLTEVDSPEPFFAREMNLGAGAL
jgi:ATPase subunit of ABC transporter with duplicated ATPase domains